MTTMIAHTRRGNKALVVSEKIFIYAALAFSVLTAGNFVVSEMVTRWQKRNAQARHPAR